MKTIASEAHVHQTARQSLVGKKVLVTGAGGFIGSHLTEMLVESGAEVTAMLRYNANSNIGNLAALPKSTINYIDLKFGNIEDADFIRHTMKRQDIVFHLAALIAIPYSYIAPRSYMRTNIEGTLNILEAARNLQIQRVIHTSTSEVYGSALRTPIDETHPLQGQSPYSATKISADKIAESYHRSFKLPVVTIRPFNTFGPRQSARAFIPTIISQALTQEYIKLGSLEPQRDMTFVSDTADGFIAAAVTSDLEGETINLGTGTTYSIGHFAERIFTLMNVKREIHHDVARVRPDKSEVTKLLSDNTKAQRLMGWCPKVELDEGLKRTIEFVQQNRHLYQPEKYMV